MCSDQVEDENDSQKYTLSKHWEIKSLCPELADLD